MSEPEVWIESESVWRTRFRLARRLGWGALASVVLPVLLVGLTGSSWIAPGASGPERG